MSDLTPREREFVALGAAMGSNCISCVEYHILESRKVGLTDPEILATIQYADTVRQVPARRTLQAALKLLSSTPNEIRNEGSDEARGCGTATEATKVETDQASHPHDMMMGMMSKMMDICGSRGQSASAASSAEKKPTVNPAKSEGCGCG